MIAFVGLEAASIIDREGVTKMFVTPSWGFSKVDRERVTKIFVAGTSFDSCNFCVCLL